MPVCKICGRNFQSDFGLGAHVAQAHKKRGTSGGYKRTSYSSSNKVSKIFETPLLDEYTDGNIRQVGSAWSYESDIVQEVESIPVRIDKSLFALLSNIITKNPDELTLYDVITIREQINLFYNPFLGYRARAGYKVGFWSMTSIIIPEHFEVNIALFESVNREIQVDINNGVKGAVLWDALEWAVVTRESYSYEWGLVSDYASKIPLFGRIWDIGEELYGDLDYFAVNVYDSNAFYNTLDKTIIDANWGRVKRDIKAILKIKSLTAPHKHGFIGQQNWVDRWIERYSEAEQKLLRS